MRHINTMVTSISHTKDKKKSSSKKAAKVTHIARHKGNSPHITLNKLEMKCNLVM